MDQLTKLIEEYGKAPAIFQAGRYWKAYEDKIIAEIKKADINELRSGKYPIFATFGFNESVYPKRHTKSISKRLKGLFASSSKSMPYSLGLKDIREMAYNHCVLQGELAKVKPISEIEVSPFGNPEDLFEIHGKKYTMSFLTYYVRLCYAQRHLHLKGDEIIVELGSGSGHQVEILKKVFPDLTILCFDLPYTLYLCNEYLCRALGQENIISPSESINKTDLKDLKKRKVHMFGNWQFPILKNFKFDVFWNAASFGEMEPDIVKNYLSYVLSGCQSVYLLQARHGKESTKKKGVTTPITFDNYVSMLNDFKVMSEADAFQAHRRLSDSGGYFHAVWRREV